MQRVARGADVNGFTLVELLIGLFLSTFIVGVTMTYFVSTSRTFRIHTNESVIQENARFAFDFLAQQIRHAGVNPSNNLFNDMEVVLTESLCTNSESGLRDGASGNFACTRDGDDNNTENNSDRLAVDYMIDRTKETTAQSFTLCNGTTVKVAAGDEVRVASVIWSGDIDGDGVRSLYCQALNLDTGQAEGAATPLIDGIERMQVQYALDRNGDGVVERYQSFTNLGANNSDRVRSIRIALLVSSGLGTGRAEVSTEQSETRTYSLLDGKAEDFEADSVLRQIYTTTMLVHNFQGDF